MCGIAGFIDFHHQLEQHHLLRMRDALAYRGPDDKGDLLLQTPAARIGLGHRRLSILDLSPMGHQPMTFEGHHIVFNGEIYNFMEIRAILEGKGYRFESHCDTEVILKAFIEWGVACVDRFIGMFAFAIYNQRDNELYLFRDRAGVKPLYYSWNKGRLLFASELKSFHGILGFEKRINLESVRMFMNFGYIPAPHSIFEHTYKVRPGSYLKFNLNTRHLDEVIYWNVVEYYNKPKIDISLSEVSAEIEKILISAFNYRMVADVPVGVFLSGGYDSSILTAILQKNSTRRIKTFTIGFNEEDFNEANHAKSIAEHLGTDHSEHYCSSRDAIDLLPQLPYIYDEPFGDSSAIPTTLVSKLAVQEVKVALSADAGDETFAGYKKYITFLEYFKKFNSIPWPADKLLAWGTRNASPLLRKLLKNAYNIDTRIYKLNQLLENKRDINTFFKTLSQFYGDIELDNLIVAGNAKRDSPTYFDERLNHDGDELNKMLAIDYKTYMSDDILTKIDRATMSVSLEGREPLLDHRIIEFAAQLPSDFKYRDGSSKFILKQIAHHYIPQSLLDRPKMGFGIPVEIWLRDALKPFIGHYLDEDRIRRNGLFNPAKVEEIKKAFFTGRKFNVTKLWFLLMFEMWHEYWME